MTTDRPSFLARPEIRRTALTALLVLLGCYAGARAGTLLQFPQIGAAVLFPPYAVLAAALILSPARRWWLYVLASAVGNFWPHLQHEGLPSFVMMAEAANISRALVAACGVRWLGQRAGHFDTLRGTIVFIVFAVVLGPVVGALIGALDVVLHNPTADFYTTWQAWLLSNMLTGLTLLPLLLIACTYRGRWIGRASPARIVEAVVLSIGVLAVGAYIFIGARGGRLDPASVYAPLPLLLWAAVRFGPGGMIAALCSIAGLTIAGALSGRGPFVVEAPAQNLIHLQYFLIALCSPLLLLAALVRQQRETATELARSRAEYRAVVEDQTELICRFLPDGTYTFVNDAYCRYFKRSPDQLLGRTFWEFIPAEAHEGLRRLLASITNESPAAEIEHEVIAPGGERRWQHWVNRALFDEQGRTVAYQAVGRDITERKAAEESLRLSNRELSLLKDRLQAQNTYLQEELTASESAGDIICRSATMRQTLAHVQRVAKTDATVLILGETGVGKEVLARAIHRGSDRKSRPFVRLNCAALPPHLIESELFGHERGAFTGAAARRLGRFEVANDATLFLDEIGELPLELQSKLLRVLQENEFERLGSSKTISVDVRLVAATSRDLQECVQKGSFRADLFYRLNVFPIAVPPLRSRKEDIMPLATAFLAKVGQRLGKEFAPISAAVAESLLHHRWPGNVRELENVIERAAISSPGEVLELPDGWDGGVEPTSSARIAPPRSAGSAGSGQVQSKEPNPSLGSSDLVSIRELERAHILLALERSRWRIEGPDGAAVALGIKPSTLRFRMKKYSISRDSGKTAHT